LVFSLLFLFEHDLYPKTADHFSGSCFFEHDLFRKRLPTFRDHALRPDRKEKAGASVAPALFI